MVYGKSVLHCVMRLVKKACVVRNSCLHVQVLVRVSSRVI